MFIGLCLVPGTSYAQHGPHGEARQAIRQEVRRHFQRQKEERLSENDQLTEDEKSERIGLFEAYYQERKAFHRQKHAERILALAQIASDPGITKEENALTD